MSDRFYCEAPISDDLPTYTLSGAEGHHLSRVMRKRAGDEVILFDGSGREFHATIVSVQRDAAELTIDSVRLVDRERSIPIHLAVAIPKGDRQKVLLEKAVEIGVHRLIPLHTTRSQHSYSEKSRERWRRYVIEASKQCRRNRLMEIGETTSLDQLLTDCKMAARWIAHPSHEDLPDGEAAPSVASTREAIIAIGPEGGFTDEEVTTATSLGWNRLDLGPRILRIETAAIAAVCRYDQ